MSASVFNSHRRHQLTWDESSEKNIEKLPISNWLIITGFLLQRWAKTKVKSTGNPMETWLKNDILAHGFGRRLHDL